MEELPLPGLLPDDPENRLSEEARRRVARALAECNRIQWDAIATAQARHLSDEKTRYLNNQADLKGARVVLRVLAAEFVDAGFNLKEFWAAMRDKIESVSNSFSLYDTQRRLLEAEFLTPPEQKNHARPRPSLTSPTPAKAETVGAQIQRLRVECDLKEEALAEHIGIDIRSVQRHLASEQLPRALTLRKYEKTFPKLLNRQIVIRGTP